MGSEEKIVKYVMTQEQLNNIIAISNREGIKAYKEERIKEERKRLREADPVQKIRRALPSYPRVKAGLKDEITFTEDEQKELRWKFFEDLMGNSSDIIRKTEIKMQEDEDRRKRNEYAVKKMETALEHFKEEYEVSRNEEFRRRYRVITSLYLDNEKMTVEEVAVVENVSEKTVFRDINAACKILADYMVETVFI